MSHVPFIKQAVKIAEIQVLELNSAYITGTILDERGLPVPLSDVVTFTVQIYDDASGDVINARDNQSVLNTNGGTYHSTSGAFTFDFESADNPIVGSGLDRGDTEVHTARFTLTWGASGRWDGEVRLKVINLNKVP